MTDTSDVKVPLGVSFFYDIIEILWNYGVEVKPRGLACKELVNFSYTLPPRVRFMSFDARKLKLDYVKQEFLWYLRADNKDTSIRHVAKMWDGLINRDGTINSNYGYYLFNPAACDGERSNFQRVAAELIADRDSRRAAICILDNQHLASQTRDYPCTSYLNFHIRDNELIMYVRMRSQDAIYGMGNDAPCFSLTHELMWSYLLPAMPDLEMGAYHHSADSFHVYERHYEMVEKILADPVVTVDHHDACPRMDNGLLFKELAIIADDTGRVIQARDVGQPWLEQLQPFTWWLLEREDPATLLQTEHTA